MNCQSNSCTQRAVLSVVLRTLGKKFAIGEFIPKESYTLFRVADAADALRVRHVPTGT